MSEIASQFSYWTIGLIVVIALLTLYFQLFRYSSRTAEAAPTILTSIGIFGTFLGVALGLSEFNTNNLQESVPQLLSGLKTAFWSSIAGLLGALTIKFRAVMDATKSENISTKAISIDDLHRCLLTINDALTVHSDHGLANETQIMRHEIQQHFGNLRDDIKNYQTEMVEANTRALIDALGVVMRDFNTKIDEQYGDNFKRLNDGVGKMLEWQIAYKEQLVDLASNQERIGKAMIHATDAFGGMVSHAESFNGISESLGEMLRGLNTQRDVLDKHLTGLAKLVTEAGAGLPKLEERMSFLTTGMAEHLEVYNQRMENLLTLTGKNIHQTTQTLTAELLQAYEHAFKELDGRIIQTLAQTDKQIAKLDTALEQELNKALKTMGQQLAALSEKFVDDYGPLTERLQSIVQMANQHVNR